ncbi:MMGT1 (predicted) [Pycnogonum litorale]
MPTAMYKFLTGIGLMSLVHVAYSAAQHRSYLRITEQEFTGLPANIVIQGLISLFMTMYGVVYVSGEFKAIRATVELENKSFETFRNRPSFYSLNHRGKALSPCFEK